MKATIISALIVVAMAVTLWVGGCFAGKPETANLEQMPVNSELGIYGTASTSAVWPLWSVQVSWERKLPVYVDAYGPTTHLVQLANRPQLGDISKYIPQPYYLKGKYTATAVFNIVQVGAKQEPIEQNPPSKSE
jgi:hypothetical protein